MTVELKTHDPRELDSCDQCHGRGRWQPPTGNGDSLECDVCHGAGWVLRAPTLAPGRKDDQAKPRPYTVLPWDALAWVLRVGEYGAAKYGVDNWRGVSPPERYLDAAMRHLMAHRSGELADSESGLPHLAHAACSLLFALALVSQQKEGMS